MMFTLLNRSSPRLRPVVHESPEANLFDNIPTQPIAGQVERITKILTWLSSRRPSAEVCLQPGMFNHEMQEVIDLQELIADRLALKAGSFGLRLLVTTNQDLHTKERQKYREQPIYNVHTDFRTKSTWRGRELKLSDNARIAAVFGGEGTVITSGRVEADGLEFVAPKSGGANYETLMSIHKSALFGADGQIVRGPASKNKSYAFTGDFEHTTMPDGVFFELSPRTLHQPPEFLGQGRSVLNIDIVD